MHEYSRVRKTVRPAPSTALVKNVAEKMRIKFAQEGSGHDWYHIERVWRMARYLAWGEGADLETAELAALTHDIADWKLHDGDETIGPNEAAKLLREEGADESLIGRVTEIVATLSFKGAGVPTPMKTIEGSVVQDADRLDAIGAIGIARCFSYGGFMGRLIYDPEIEITLHQSAGDYRCNTSSSLNHFHEKLYLLKDRMNTETARNIATERHHFMQEYEKRFLAEWGNLSNDDENI